MLSRQPRNDFALCRLSGAAGHYHPAVGKLCERRDGALDLAAIVHVDEAQFQSKRWCERLDRTKQSRTGRDASLAKDCRPSDAWCDLLEQLQPFPADGILVDREAGHVAAGTRQAFHIAGCNRVCDTGEHDRDGAACFQQGRDSAAGKGEDDIRRERNELGCMFSCDIDFAVAPAIVDADILPIRPTELLHGLDESPYSVLRFRVVYGPRCEHADAPNSLRLLRRCRQRPYRRCAAEQRDELAPSDHSITSSATASSPGGKTRPSAFAVVRLTMSSNLVGCSTGRLAGFAPRSILSTYSAARLAKCSASGP